MINAMPKENGVWEWLLAILMFPTLFQSEFLHYAWGANDTLWMTVAKRIFVMLPVLAIIAACWLSAASLFTILFRANRTQFMTHFFATWFDLGRSIFTFWGGTFRFVFILVGAFFEVFKMLVAAVIIFIQDVALVPFRLVRNLGENVLNPGVPWIAITLTFVWSVIEAAVMTFVMRQTVIDTLGNITGETLSENFVQIPLFAFLLFLILGSYSVVSKLIDTWRARQIQWFIGILCLEAVAVFVEVGFLYKEFVDALIFSWQRSNPDFEPGILGTLALAFMMWLGVRTLTWFLFASAGTPTIMAVIQGSGIGPSMQNETARENSTLKFISGYISKIKSEGQWFHQKGEEILAAFILPPIQVIAATINFCMLLLRSEHLYHLPFKSISDVVETSTLIKGLRNKSGNSGGKV